MENVIIEQIKNEKKIGKKGEYIFTGIKIDGEWYNGFGNADTLNWKAGDTVNILSLYEEEYNGTMMKKFKLPFVFYKLEDLLEKGKHVIEVEPHIKDGVHLLRTAKNGNVFKVYKAYINGNIVFINAWGDNYKFFDTGKIYVTIKQKEVKVLDEYQLVYLNKEGKKTVLPKGTLKTEGYTEVLISFVNEYDEFKKTDKVILDDINTEKQVKPKSKKSIVENYENNDVDDDLPF